MARILAAVITVAVLVGCGVVAVRGWSTLSQTSSSRTLDDRTVELDGKPVTCATLVPGGCDFDLQFAFDRWGGQIGVYAAADLGPWARGAGTSQSVVLGLRACSVSRTPGKTFLEFVDVAHRTVPDASSPELFPIWRQARTVLCPTV
ncbi:hypothetical protein [Prescottella subtropica]|uniref:hypothetical protein n=1 Tax=Prescottella subtropica TaxID=2545757 RepID=UPI0010F4BB79|nr:hypothetical protein [Prescottella subtropica]